MKIEEFKQLDWAGKLDELNEHGSIVFDRDDYRMYSYYGFYVLIEYREFFPKDIFAMSIDYTLERFISEDAFLREFKKLKL